MGLEVRGQILGFEDTNNVEIHEVDDLFSTLRDMDNENISFTIINPYLLREYSFDIPVDMKILLNLTEESNVSVYNIAVIQDPLENSSINFLAPLIINNDNNKIGQALLDTKKHPNFGMSEQIKSFRE